jgi:mono/diheme cytochrome c family protein
MHPRQLTWILTATALLTGGSLQAKLSAEKIAALPPAASRTVSFRADIKPILETSCVKCHGKGKSKGGFNLDVRESLLKGGDSGASVVIGNSGESYLIELVSGFNLDSIMPEKGTKLTPLQVGLLRAWIDQGLAWDSDISFAKQPPRNLEPRRVELPTTEGSQHPIDRLLAASLRKAAINPEKLVDDRTFARRVYLDVIGLLPPPEELAAFLASSEPAKRERLVDRLLGDNQAYATHWFSFWNDLLRNDYRGTGYIDGGRKQISTWLHSALATNLPYDRFVAQLVHPTPETEGFTKGIVWRGVVNASQTPPMQAAQNISQIFMGVNLKCASCHDSFIDDWALADCYGMANLYADEPLELVQCDKPIGKKAVTQFLYPQLGAIAGDLPKTNRTARLAEIMTRSENGRLPRTVVNRLWARLLGHGLVEPIDDMEQKAWSPDLLDWLAEDLVANGYNLKHTLKRILTSQAYQLPAVNLSETPNAQFVFQGPAIRRLSAEQFRDALGALTGVWHSDPANEFDLAAGASEAFLETVRVPAEAQWVWSHPGAETKAAPGDLFLRKSFTLEALPDRATVVALADDSWTVFVNGTQVVSGKDLKSASHANLKPHLKVGVNLIAVQAANAAPKPPEKDKKPADPASPAGVIVFARLETGTQLLELYTDRTWTCTTNNPADWKKPDFGASAWLPAVELGSIVKSQTPWTGGLAALTRALSLEAAHGHIRASLVPADPLTTALGRPNREQVMTSRTSAATTLQALELSNGETLAGLVKAGASKWTAKSGPVPRELSQQIFQRGLGRPPTAREQELANDLLGQQVKPEHVEDLLWAIAMLPEFQLIY